MWQDLPSLAALSGDAVGWIHAHLPAPCSAAETVRQAARSTVVRLDTDDGALYFKADHILPPPEAVIISRLAQHNPQFVPRVLAVEETNGWSLTQDAGATGPTSLDEESTDVWRAVARAFGELQRNTGLGPDGWAAVGCRDLRGPKLFESFRAMIEHASALSDPGLDASDRAALQRLLPRIEEACDDLMSDGLPATLVHQDLVPENLIWNAGQVVFLDWSDTVVGHPFFGLDRLLDSCWSDRGRKAAVIGDYLAGFEDFASPERLRQSFDRVLWLRVLYEDLRWHHEILALPPSSEQAQRLRLDQLHGLRMVATRHV